MEPLGKRRRYIIGALSIRTQKPFMPVWPSNRVEKMATNIDTNRNGLPPKEEDETIFIAATAKDAMRVNIKLGWMNSFEMQNVMKAVDEFIQNWSRGESDRWTFGLSTVNIYDGFVSFSIKLREDNIWIEGVPFKTGPTEGVARI